MPNTDEMEKINFWCPRNLADQVRHKLLDHKIATRERLTITDILTQALRDYVNTKAP